jgi:CheY-like chemotaxis protein
MKGYDVRTAEDGLAAVEVAAAFAPDVVLLDIGLPLLDGYEVARRLRQLPQTRDVRIVALTGYGLPADRQRGREAGFDQHLLKPVDPVALADLIAKWSDEDASATGAQGAGAKAMLYAFRRPSAGGS